MNLYRSWRTIGHILLTVAVWGMCVVPVHAAAAPIIADHRAVIEFDQIPEYWLGQAKLLTFHFAHTSHGSQIVSGITALENLNPLYSVAIRTSAASAELPPAENPPALRIYDGNPPETYITPDDYWQSADGISRTRAVVGTGWFNISGWSWCGEQSFNSTSTVQQYLDQMTAFETLYPGVTFIYMTGHTDGSQDTAGSTLGRNNQMVRDYVTAHHKVLFDFADIESWDPDGHYFTNTTDACAWCTTWCANHPTDCTGLTGSCAHSHPYNCKLKAKAFWWLMARLAGWPGAGQAPPDPTPTSLPTAPPTATPVPTATATPLATLTPTHTAAPSPTVAGDATGDGIVDVHDYFVWLSHFSQPVSGAENGDFDGNSKVDGIDYVVWLIHSQP